MRVNMCQEQYLGSVEAPAQIHSVRLTSVDSLQHFLPAITDDFCSPLTVIDLLLAASFPPC